MVWARAVVTIGYDPDWELVDQFRELPSRWRDEVLLTIAKRRPGLLEEVLGDVELARAGAAAVYGCAR